MKKIFCALFFLPLFIQAQSNDTSYFDYVSYADEAYAEDNNSIVAYQLYVKAIILAAELGPPEELYTSLAEVYEVIGAMSYDFTLYDYARIFYERSLGFYRAIDDMDGIVRVIPKIALSYKAMRENDINGELISGEEFETAEVYYRIIDEPIYKDGEVWVKINGGIFDGLYATSVGYVYATHKAPFVDRANVKLGKATVLELDTNASYLQVSPVASVDSFYQIYQGDMVMMLSLIPKREYKSVLWQLALQQQHILLPHPINPFHIFL